MGVWPWLFDKIMGLFTGKDFQFTLAAKQFADHYPLTCWTGPAMREAFAYVYQTDGTLSERKKERFAKLGASFAVIVGHVVPFMGAQTTIMQRYFLPHPLDTIVSQPFGMTEDLVSMAMAEATSNPSLASWTLTALVVLFNLARGLIFTGHPVEADDPSRAAPYVRKKVAPPNTTSPAHSAGSPALSSLDSASPGERDWVAIASALFNILAGVGASHIVAGNLPAKEAFAVVAVQMMTQLLIIPIFLGWVGDLFKQPTTSSSSTDS